MGRRKGIAGLVTAVAAAALVALLPTAAVAHPSCATGESGFLSLDAAAMGWSTLPAAESLYETECSATDAEAAQAFAESIAAAAAAAEPIPGIEGVYTKSANMRFLGSSARQLPLIPNGQPNALAAVNSDLAFKDDLLYQGHFNGFRILDVSDPANPVQLSSYEDCVHGSGQGDIVVWGDILVRTWDSSSNTGSLTCGGQPVGTGFEGIHIFDVGDPENPVFVKQLRMAPTNNEPGAPTPACGAHTATGVPDAARGDLYLYVGGSSGTCQGMDIVRIDIENPADAVYLRRALASRQCHDNNVIMGDVNLAMCAGGNGFSVFSFDPELDADAPGGIANPTLLYSRSVPGVTIAHSGSFSYDGEVLVFGHEPGGGTAAQCQASSSVTARSLFFVEAATGNTLGTLLTPRPQGNQENCTWHNFNVVPTHKGRYAVTGNYQAGIQVIDFTNPAAPQSIAFADPAPLSPSTPIVSGGDWSTYWHNGVLYESDIRKGLITWELDEDAVSRARTFSGDHNPQTQPTSFEQDLAGPEIEIASPVAGTDYTKGSTVLADFACADAQSGVESCVGTVADGAPIATGEIGHHTFTVIAKDNAGNESTRSVQYSVLHTSANTNVSGTVPGTLGLTLGPAVILGPFVPGFNDTYSGGTTANVISTAGHAVLSVADASPVSTGHLVNGEFALPQPLQARARNAANTSPAFNNVGSAASPLNLLEYNGPISNDAVELDFQQRINANDALRTGTYSKTITFTLSTTSP